MQQSIAARMRGYRHNSYLVGIVFIVIATCCYFLWVPTQQPAIPSMHHLLRRHGEGREAPLKEHASRTTHAPLGQPVELWAAGTRHSDASKAATLWSLLSTSEQDAVTDLCGRYVRVCICAWSVHTIRCVFHTLLHSTVVRGGGLVFVRTGDINVRKTCDSSSPHVLNAANVGPRHCRATRRAHAAHGARFWCA